MIKRWLVPFFGRPARSMNLLFSVTTLLIANSIVALFLTETTSLMVLALLGQSVLIWLIMRILDRGLRSLLRKKGEENIYQTDRCQSEYRHSLESQSADSFEWNLYSASLYCFLYIALSLDGSLLTFSRDAMLLIAEQGCSGVIS